MESGTKNYKSLGMALPQRLKGTGQKLSTVEEVEARGQNNDCYLWYIALRNENVNVSAWFFIMYKLVTVTASSLLL